MISTWAASQMDVNMGHSITDKYNPQLHLMYHPTGMTELWAVPRTLYAAAW